ncbi:type 2 lanthipeptide synthetase LanM [Nonomuraea jiangxiensis]|uniref:type 2 lanthipeptide synthetase LanM n=1 Tax=Nonomuraea jiangxiensis TaxID=633440 RepID=UPI0015A4AAA8|nr:type 2 lanthipeptide synthetase LanM [Nonomuraea jiangxiensis]
MNESTPASPWSARRISVRLYGSRYDEVPFSGLMARFADRYEALLRSAAETGQDLLTRQAWDSLVENLIGDLVAISHRTLILELHRARSGGLLQGDTPEERYRDYSDRLLGDPAYLASLFRTYPLLEQALERCAGNWMTTCLELLSRLRADLPLLRRHGFLTGGAEAVSSLRTGLGDPHNGGRSVTEVTFTGGDRVVYKPRALDAEELYGQAVTLLNELNGEPDLRAMRVINRAAYGWCEFVGHRPAAGQEGIGRFYRRIGSCVALLTCLTASDIHMENLRADGEHPVPVDLETILQPPAPPGAGSELAADLAFELLSTSVLATAMVPGRQLSMETSAIGGGLATAPRRKPALVEPFTDAMRTELVPAALEQAANLPFLEHGRVRPADHVADVVSGFLDAYDTIAAHKPAFRELIRRFRDAEIRYLVRPTRIYGLLLGELHHPRRLGADDHASDQLLTALATSPELASVAAAERSQLLAGDIPRFSAAASSTTLRFQGAGEIPGFFGESGRQRAEHRLDRFGPQDRAVQAEILTAALSTLPDCPATEPPRRPPDPGTSLRDSTRQAIDALADDAVLGRADCTWIGLAGNSVRGEPITYGPLPTRLYDGLSGMALLFACAARVYADDRYLDLAIRSIHPVVTGLRGTGQRQVGAYSGTAGDLYVLGHLAVVTADEGYVEAIERCLPSFVRDLGTRQDPGLVSGLAGAAVVASDLYERYGLDDLAAAVALCAERLVSGSPWEGVGDGFAHGTAGIGWALLRAGRVLDDAELRDVGLRALAGDDPRDPAPPDGGTRAWCQGAAGTGIARLLAHRPDFDQEVARAVAAVAQGREPVVHGLCHGDLGRLEFLRLAADRLPGLGREPYLRMRLDLLTSGAIGSHAYGSRFPGLLVGRAGACLTLLRLVAPGAVPSVLWLEGPTRREHHGSHRQPVAAP